MPFAKWRKFMCGAGKGRAGYVGLQKFSATVVGNVGSGEDDLHSHTLESATLYVNGQSLRFTAFGKLAPNGNSKTVKLYFGGSVVATFVSSANDKNWFATAIIIRKAADVQRTIGWCISDTTVATPTFGELTVDDGADIVMKVTGEGTSTDDITCEGSLVEVLTQ